jgi:hypothetical protein
MQVCDNSRQLEELRSSAKFAGLKQAQQGSSGGITVYESYIVITEIVIE